MTVSDIAALCTGSEIGLTLMIGGTPTSYTGTVAAGGTWSPASFTAFAASADLTNVSVYLAK